MGRVWDDSTTEIVRKQWGKKTPAQIAASINGHLRNVALSNGKKSWVVTSPRGGGVVWKAAEIGLITTKEREAWQAEENRRKQKARSKAGERHLRQSVIERDGGACLRCGSTKSLQIDHIIPVFLGGSSDFDNLQTLCQKCNLQKGINVFDYYHCTDCGKPANRAAVSVTTQLWSDGSVTNYAEGYLCKQCASSARNQHHGRRISANGAIKRIKPRPKREKE